MPISDIKSDDALVKALDYILDNEADIRKHLSGMLKDYKQQSLNAINRVKERV